MKMLLITIFTFLFYYFSLNFASNGQRFSLVAPAPVKIDLGLFTGRDSSLGVVVLGLASSSDTLVNSDSAVTMSTLINDSTEVVEIRGSGTKSVEVVDGTIIRGTVDVEESKKTTVVFDVGLGVEDHGTGVVFASLKKTTSINGITVVVDIIEGDIDTSKGHGGKAKDADKQ